MNFGTIDSALSAVQASAVPSAVSIAMLDNSMEQSETMGASMVKMMEHSVNPHIGGNIDVSV